MAPGDSTPEEASFPAQARDPAGGLTQASPLSDSKLATGGLKNPVFSLGRKLLPLPRSRKGPIRNGRDPRTGTVPSEEEARRAVSWLPGPPPPTRLGDPGLLESLGSEGLGEGAPGAAARADITGVGRGGTPTPPGHVERSQ